VRTSTTDTLTRQWIEKVKRFQIVPFEGGRCNVFHKTFEICRSRRPPLTESVERPALPIFKALLGLSICKGPPLLKISAEHVSFPELQKCGTCS